MPFVRNASGTMVFEPVLPGKTSTGLTKLPTTTKPAQTSKASLFYQEKEKQNLSKLLMSAGLTKEAAALTAPPKLSVLQRIGRGLSAFETGDALYAKLYEDKSFLKEYAKDIMQGIGAAVTGREIGTGDPKKTFKDIMMMEGMRDRPGKLDAVDIAGLAGDILTDPTTFLGSTFGKGIVKGVGLTSKALKSAPLIGKAITGVEMTMEGLFKPFSKVEKLGEIGKAYRSSFDAFAKGTRAEVDDFVNEMATRATKVKSIPLAGEKIGVGIEEGGGAIPKVADTKAKASGQSLIDEASKYRSAEEFVNGQTEKGTYYQHVVRSGTDIGKLKTEGFKSGIGPNALPTYSGKPSNTVEMQYRPKEGDTVILIPKSKIINSPNGPKVMSGYIPKDADIIKIGKGTLPPLEQKTSQLTDIWEKANQVIKTRSQLKAEWDGVEKGIQAIQANPEEKLLNDVIDELLNTQKVLTGKESERGILKTELQNYMHHMLTPEAREYYNKGGNLTQYLKPIRVKLGAALQRGISSFTDEAGNRIIGKASALGLKPIGKIKGLADDISYGTFKTFKDIEEKLAEYGYKLRLKPQSTVHRTAGGYFSPAKKEIVIAAKQPTVEDVLSILKHEITHSAHFDFGGILEMIETITGRGQYAVMKKALVTLKDAAKVEKEGIWKAIGINWKTLSPAKKKYYSEPTELLAYGMQHSQKNPALAQELFPQTYELLQEFVCLWK